MLTIYKTDSEKVYSAEYVFNQRLPVIKRMTDVLMPSIKKRLATIGMGSMYTQHLVQPS